MGVETVFGIAAGIVTSIRLFPQVFKTMKLKKADDLSFWFLILLSSQTLLLIGYGLTKPDVYIMFMNIIPLVCSCILLILKHAYSTPTKKHAYAPRDQNFVHTLRQKLNTKTSNPKKVFFIHQHISK